MLNIKTAKNEDLSRIIDFYYSLIDANKDSEYRSGWKKGVYSTQEFLTSSINNNELYIGENEGKIIACMAVNHEYNKGYEDIRWSVEAKDSELVVIHALGVHPDHSCKGIAKQMVRYVIENAGKNGIKTIRLDVLDGNIPAERAYTKMRFVYLGTVKMFYEDTGLTDYRLFEYIV